MSGEGAGSGRAIELAQGRLIAALPIGSERVAQAVRQQAELCDHRVGRVDAPEEIGLVAIGITDPFEGQKQEQIVELPQRAPAGDRVPREGVEDLLDGPTVARSAQELGGGAQGRGVLLDEAARVRGSGAAPRRCAR